MGRGNAVIRPSWKPAPRLNPQRLPNRPPKPNDPKLRPAGPNDKGQPKMPHEIMDDLRPFPHQPRWLDMTPEGGFIPPILLPKPEDYCA